MPIPELSKLPHWLHQALSRFILELVNFTYEEKDVLEILLSDAQKSTVSLVDNNYESISVKDKFTKSLQNMQLRRPTAQLWVLYYKMVTLVKQYIEAERRGGFQLHVDTVKRMILFFHAAGYRFDAKCAYLYTIQEMACLKNRMDPLEFLKFNTEGFLTIRRTGEFWSGIWTNYGD